MARSYLPSRVPEIVELWRKDLTKVVSPFHSYYLFPVVFYVVYVMLYKEARKPIPFVYIICKEIIH